MMSTVTFDTLKFSKRLIKAGATPELADALAEAQKESLSEILDTQLATKTDIEKLKYEIKLNRWMSAVIMAAVVLLLIKELIT